MLGFHDGPFLNTCMDIVVYRQWFTSSRVTDQSPLYSYSHFPFLPEPPKLQSGTCTWNQKSSDWNACFSPPAYNIVISNRMVELTVKSANLERHREHNSLCQTICPVRSTSLALPIIPTGTSKPLTCHIFSLQRRFQPQWMHNISGFYVNLPLSPAAKRLNAKGRAYHTSHKLKVRLQKAREGNLEWFSMPSTLGADVAYWQKDPQFQSWKQYNPYIQCEARQIAENSGPLKFNKAQENFQLSLRP